MIDPTRFAGTDQDVHGLLDKQQALRSEARTEKQLVADLRPIPKHHHGDRFVRGPIPYDWLRAALSFGGKAGNLAWSLWWLAGVERANPIRLTRRALTDFNVSTRAARRLLSDFERAGLVEVARKRGRSPIVTLKAPAKSALAQERKTDRTDSPRMNARGEP